MKKISFSMPVFLFFMMLSFFSATPSHADLYWESIQETTGMPGKPDESQEIKNYLTSYASRSDHKNRIVIMNFEAKTMIQIDPSKKTYHQTNLTEMVGPPMIKGEKGEAQRQMMKQKMGNIKVTPTDETRKIGDYTCKKYLVSGMMMNSEYWLSKDVTGYEEMKKTAEKLKDMFDQNPMMKQMNIAGMISQLDGFPVQMIMTIMNGKTITTLKKIEQKTLDKSLFSVPDGYTRIEGPMMPMMRKPANKGPAAMP
jgi:hypothetical protein